MYKYMNSTHFVFSPILRRRSDAFLLSSVLAVQVGISYFGLPGWQCPIYHATGIPCPGCGLSRATVILLQGDWQTALRLHAFAPLFLLIYIIVVISTLLPKYYRQDILKKTEAFEAQTGISYVFFISLFLYWGIRIVLFPTSFISLINNL